jgi:glycine/D-amino acid oxidase-like deaminating enzyme
MDPSADPEAQYDVAIVGGGPAGSSAAVFCARYGLDTVIFDRGRASLKRCAFLENYLGFPAGIDVETLYGLLHEHVERAGGRIVPDQVVDVRDREEGFVVEPDEGDSVTARRVVAAARYDPDAPAPWSRPRASACSGYHTSAKSCGLGSAQPSQATATASRAVSPITAASGTTPSGIDRNGAASTSGAIAASRSPQDGIDGRLSGTTAAHVPDRPAASRPDDCSGSQTISHGMSSARRTAA